MSIDTERVITGRAEDVHATLFDTDSGGEEVAATISDLGLDAIIVVGGNGSISVAWRASG